LEHVISAAGQGGNNFKLFRHSVLKFRRYFDLNFPIFLWAPQIVAVHCTAADGNSAGHAARADLEWNSLFPETAFILIPRFE
jgi:hypothetical protein